MEVLPADVALRQSFVDFFLVVCALNLFVLVVKYDKVFVPEKRVSLSTAVKFALEAISDHLRKALLALLSVLVGWIPAFTGGFTFEYHCLARDFATPIGKKNSGKLIWVTSLKQVFDDQAESEVLFDDVDSLDLSVRGSAVVEDELNLVIEFVHCNMDNLASFFDSLDHMRKLAEALNKLGRHYARPLFPDVVALLECPQLLVQSH